MSRARERRRRWRRGPTANTARRGTAASPPMCRSTSSPPVLQPLIRHNGVTDRRRWESALFLKVRDEIQTGNLAIEGAKNFGRFEAFFLPSAQWEQVLLPTTSATRPSASTTAGTARTTNAITATTERPQILPRPHPTPNRWR